MFTHKQIIKEVSQNFTPENQEENNPHMIRMFEVFTQHQNKEDWRYPFDAFVYGLDAQDREYLKAGIEWYHAADAVEDGNFIVSPGYQAW